MGFFRGVIFKIEQEAKLAVIYSVNQEHEKNQARKTEINARR